MHTTESDEKSGIKWPTVYCLLSVIILLLSVLILRSFSTQDIHEKALYDAISNPAPTYDESAEQIENRRHLRQQYDENNHNTQKTLQAIQDEQGIQFDQIHRDLQQ